MSAPAWLARYAASKRFGRLPQMALSRPYTSRTRRRVAFVYEANRIAFSQIFPFIRHARAICARHDVELRFFSADRLDVLDFTGVDDVIVQLWFERDPADFDRVFSRAAQAGTRVVAFLDSFAHNNLILANQVDSHISYYLKKSLFKDTSLYSKVTLGDTNLMDYYSRLYKVPDTERSFVIPEGFVNKLRLSPNFFTDSRLEQLFLSTDIDALLAVDRSIDVHARLGSVGTGWYGAMRGASLDKVSALSGCRVLSEGLVPRKTYMEELRQAKICFSPFGYGELCWRDLEAMACGALVLKPDMDHLRTLPNLYEADVTYVPIRWDFSDLEDRVRWIMANPNIAKNIAREAFSRVRTYLDQTQFVDDMGFLFSE